MPCNFGCAALGGVASAVAIVTLVTESVGAGLGAVAGLTAATAPFVVETGWTGTEFAAAVATEGAAVCLIDSSGCFTFATARRVSRFCNALTTNNPTSARTTTTATISRMGGPELRCWDGSAGLNCSAGGHAG